MTTRSRAEAGSTRPGRGRISSTWSRRRRIVSALMGCLLTGTAAFAATNWIIGLSGGSSGQGQAATAANLVISATTAVSPASLLYPGSTGDVVISIQNPNPFPVTITAVNLPTNTTYAAGFSDNLFSSATGGCTAATSLVAWNHANGSSGTSHTLTPPLTVAANGQSNNPLRVTLTNAAIMGVNSPNACQSQFFSMPSFTGVAATGGAGTPTTSPATSGWTS